MAVNEAGIATDSGSSTPSNWTPERVAKLLEIWPLGTSASEAAALIGGVSRNAVIGKVHRLKLPKRPQDCGGSRQVSPEALAERVQKRRALGAHRQRVRRALARGAELPKYEAPEPQAVAVSAPTFEGSLKLPFASLGPLQCRFIEGEAPDYESCGNPVAGSTSWCHHHQRVVWVPSEQRRATSYDANRRGRKVSNYVGSFEEA